MNKKIRNIGAAVLVALWVCITLIALVRGSDELSVSERRQLAQFPEISWKSVGSTDFMRDFESYTLDQFPARDTFRKIKALFHKDVMLQKDNNNIYIAVQMVIYIHNKSLIHEKILAYLPKRM